jgi:PAS domain S-box-containing protein
MTPSPSQAVNFRTDADRFHLFIDAVTDYAIYMLDENGFVESWNVGAARLKGYTAEEIIGQHFAAFFTAEDREQGVPASILRSTLNRGRHESEGWRLRKDGTRFWASAVIHKVQDRTGRHIGFAKITRDISERKASQGALLESERRFRLLVQGITDYAIYMLDPSGVVTNWNAGAERIKRYTEQEIVGRHFSLFYDHDDRAKGLPARALATAAREGRFEAEGWRVRKDGSRFWANVVIDAIFDPKGDLIGFAKITRDISERRVAEENLRTSERQFRLLVNGVTDYALFMLDLNGNVTNWNAGAERIKGYKAAEIVGQHSSKFYTASERTAGMPARALRIAAEEGRFEADGWRVRKDGSRFWANVVIDPIADEDGKLIGFSKITRDITERRNVELDMEKTRAHLAQVQKMEALGQLTGGVAHDFNNLLMVVSGFVPTLKKRLADDPRGMKAAEAIELAAQRGAALTRQLLSFSRRQSLDPTVVKLESVMDAVRPILGSLLGGAVDYVATILPEVWPVRVDPSELELALVNLTVNARDAMDRGGTITITAENTQTARDGSAGAELKGEFVALTVADTGHGIAPDILAKIFDPFFTTKPEGTGTGLGLSQVHGFVHQSGGTIDVATELGKGTRITMYFPRATAEQPLRASPGTEEGQLTGQRVLVVEDNPDVAAVTREMLLQAGAVVETVGNATEALQMIETARFDLVLSDIVMAGPMNGFDLARAIRNKHPALPVILATGYAEAAQQAATMFTVLRKPYGIDDLNGALAGAEVVGDRKILDFQSAMRERPAAERNV